MQWFPPLREVLRCVPIIPALPGVTIVAKKWVLDPLFKINSPGDRTPREPSFADCSASWHHFCMRWACWWRGSLCSLSEAPSQSKARPVLTVRKLSRVGPSDKCRLAADWGADRGSTLFDRQKWILGALLRQDGRTVLPIGGYPFFRAGGMSIEATSPQNVYGVHVHIDPTFLVS